MEEGAPIRIEEVERLVVRLSPEARKVWFEATIFSAWWQGQSGHEVCELTNVGEILKLKQLHHQVQPPRPR